MAKCKEIGKPSYELTLTNDEKNALEGYLDDCGSKTKETKLVYGIWDVLSDF
jgi:hypothetical protein